MRARLGKGTTLPGLPVPVKPSFNLIRPYRNQEVDIMVPILPGRSLRFRDVKRFDQT